MAWRLAKSLMVLLDQIDDLYPGRSKTSDGTIGDEAHQLTVSDHNPDKYGIVRAVDITHDPAHGCDIDRITDALQLGHDPRVKYVIANHLIMYGQGGPDAWRWTPYIGKDPHTNHLHLSVVADDRADDLTPWSLPRLTQEEDMQLSDTFTIPNWDKDPTLPEFERTTVQTALSVAQQRSWQALEACRQIDAQLIRMQEAISRLTPLTITITGEQATDLVKSLLTAMVMPQTSEDTPT